MKKFLSFLSIIALSSTTAATIAVENHPNKINILNQETNVFASEYIWENVGIEHSVTVPAAGTHKKTNTKLSNKATAKTSFENLSNSNTVVATGSFKFGTYKDPQAKKSIVLYKGIEESQTLKWESNLDENTHDAWNGWGHQTCKIQLVITAKENDEGIIEFNASSWIFVRTAGSVHSPHTNSIVNQFKFE